MRTRGPAATRTACRTIAAACVCGALLIGCVQAAGAQASPWLAHDHWSRAAAVRLHALNVTPGGFDPAARVHTVEATRAALAGCADDATNRTATPTRLQPRVAADASLPGGCVAAFTVERGGFARMWAEAAAGYALREGALLGGGFTPEREWTGPRRLADRSMGAARVRITAVPLQRVAFSAGIEADADGARVEQANADVRLGPFGVWAGRRVLGYAPGAGGGLVLNGAVPVDGGGVRIADAVRLAWLGAVTAELFAGRADSSGFVARPWLLGMRVHARPHARFDMGATRAAVFGGMAGARVGVEQIAEVLVGANLGGRYADDQVASLDARWRPPLRRVPLELFGEWALHDVDLEVLLDMPALTLGVRMPLIPGAAALGLTLEHTRIAGSCCGNPPWYHHFELASGWTDSGMLRGHPLGGHGREWRASLDAALVDWRVRVRADALMRTRLGENLFAPDRAGSARGGALTVTGMLSQHSGLELQLAHEAGRSWRETHAFLALSWHR